MKIHICGIYGCGKTTLARSLSKKLKIPLYSLDYIKYKVKYSKINSQKDITSRLKKIRKTMCHPHLKVWV